MTPAQQEAARRAEVMLAFSRGEVIEVRDGDVWLECSSPTWTRSADYRIKRTPIEIRVAFWLDNTGALVNARAVGFLTPEEIHRRLNERDREMVLTFREVL